MVINDGFETRRRRYRSTFTVVDSLRVDQTVAILAHKIKGHVESGANLLIRDQGMKPYPN